MRAKRMEQVQDVLVVIPARMDSTRFPGKPLAEVGGKPLIWYAWHAASTWPQAGPVVIASPDESILAAMTGFGAEVHESPPELRNGSQRAFEAFQNNPVYRVDATPLSINTPADLELFRENVEGRS